MASDLSSLIQNGLSGTLESLLAKTAKLEQTTKAHPSDLKGQCIKVDTTFKFANLTTNWSFLIPALTASYISNTMMMLDDAKPTEELDDDILDALKEVVSTISGGLTTTINGSDFEDLGSVKFSITQNEIVDGTQYSQSETLFRIPISVEEQEIIIFINFDDTILPYINAIAASEATQVIEEITPIEEETPVVEKEKEELLDEPKEELDSNDIEEVNPENNDNKEAKAKDEIKNDSNDEVEKPKDKFAFLKKLNFLKTDDDLSDEEKKQVKLKKIIILTGGLLGIIILIAILLYFTGAFEPEVIEESQDLNTTKVETKKIVKIKSVERKKYITFNITQIDTKRLNKKLLILTKYEILEEDAIERIKAKEKEKLYKEQQAKLENFAKKNKEEPIFNKIGKDTTNQSNKYDKKNNTQKNKATLNHFIQIPTLKLSQFKSFIRKAKLVKANLSICKDTSGKTQIYIGPFTNENSRTKILTTLSKKKIKDTKKLNLSKEEFDKRCSF